MKNTNRSQQGLAPAFDNYTGSWWPLLLAMVVIAAILRMTSLTLNSFWLDEVYTAAITLNPFMESIRDSLRDVHPPLFHMAISSWSQVFGTSEFALRAFSASVGILTIPTLFFIVRKPLGTKVALAFAGLTVVLPGHIYYSQEIRSYALAFLLASISIGLLVRYLMAPTKANKWWLAISCAVLFLTHYISLLLIGGIALAVLVGTDTSKRDRFREFFTVTIAIAVFIVPLSGHMLYQRLSSGSYWPSPMGLDKALDVIFELTHYDILLGIFLYLLCAVAGYQALRGQSYDNKRITAAVATAAFSPVLVGFIAAFASPGFNILLPRTMLVLGPGIILLAGIGLTSFSRATYTWALSCAFVAGSAAWLYSTGYYTTATKSDFRAASAEIARLQDQAPSELLILDGDWFCEPIGNLTCGRAQYYFRMFGVKLTPSAPNRRESAKPVIEKLIKTAHDRGAKQLILAAFNEAESQHLFAQAKARFEMTSLKTFTGTVPPYEVTINPDNVPAFTFVAAFKLEP